MLSAASHVMTDFMGGALAERSRAWNLLAPLFHWLLLLTPAMMVFVVMLVRLRKMLRQTRYAAA